MSKPRYYHLKSQLRPNGKSQIQKLIGEKKRQFLFAVVGVYGILAVTAGLFLFGPKTDNAQASETAFMSASLRFENEQAYKVGDTVKTVLTLQNTSLTEAVTNLKIDMLSTKNSVSWNKAVDLSTVNKATSESSFDGQNNIFSIPNLASGQRAEFLITGILAGSEEEMLTVLSKLRFENKEGGQEASTNRIFTKLNERNQLGNRPLTLQTDKESYARGEQANITITYEKPSTTSVVPKVEGKVYVSRKDLNSLVFNENCSLNEFGACSVQTAGLEPGAYSALFVSSDQTVLSTITEFSVDGSQGGFTPSSQAQLNLPFGAKSVNGIVAIQAQRVVNSNDQVAGQECIFEILADKKVVKTVNALVEQDRSCYTSVSTAQLPGEGIYSIRLKGTDKIQEVAFAAKPTNTVTLSNISASTSFGKSVDVQAVNLKNTLGDPLTGSSVMLGIWHPRSGSYIETGSINGVSLIVENGEFKANLPAELFSKGGLYQVIMKTSDGQNSEFLGISLTSNTVGFTGSGVIVEDYADLKVGKSPVFSVSGIRDTTGNIITSGDCGAEVYMVGSGASGVQLRGQIKNGKCTVVASNGVLNQSGPILVSFVGPNIQNDIQQSKQFILAPGDAGSYGETNLEFEPARIGYANNVILGPVTDSAGNVTSVSGLKIQIIQPANVETKVEEKLLYEVNSVRVKDGFASQTLPASVFTKSAVLLRIRTADDKIIAEKMIQSEKDESKLILPANSTTLPSDQPIKMGIVGIKSDAIECQFSWIKAQDQAVNQSVAYDADAQGCQVDWKLNQYRNTSKALAKIKLGNKVFSSIINQTNAEAANLFTFSPHLIQNSKDEFEISFISSPIVDANQLPIESGSVRVMVNGAVKEVPIKKGIAQFSLPASDINTKDIRNILDQRYLDISIEAKASVASINKYPDTSIYLGSFDIANSYQHFGIKSASSYIQANKKAVFEFATDSCNAILLSGYNTATKAKTHWQAGSCYVEVGGEEGNYRLLFEENGYTKGEYEFNTGNERIDTVWCTTGPCEVQVVGSFSGSVQAAILDGENEYTFASQDVGNYVQISKDGLNPLKEYAVEIRFKDNLGKKITVTKNILGEILLKK